MSLVTFWRKRAAKNRPFSDGFIKQEGFPAPDGIAHYFAVLGNGMRGRWCSLLEDKEHLVDSYTMIYPTASHNDPMKMCIKCQRRMNAWERLRAM